MSLVLALGRGRIAKAVRPYLEELDCRIFEGGRQLIHDFGAIKVLLVRSWDVPTFVAYGAADVGITGEDVVAEHSYQELYHPLALGVSQCTLVLAIKAGESLPARPRIATRFVRLGQKACKDRNIAAEFIQLHGALEQAPSLGLADAIIDQMDTGESLRANGLTAIESLMNSSALLIANKVAARTRMREIDDLVGRLSDFKESAGL